MKGEDGQVYSVCILQFSCFTKYNRMQPNINKQILNMQTKLLQITAFSVGITILNQRIIQKDDIEFVTEFPCLLGHTVSKKLKQEYRAISNKLGKNTFSYTYSQSHTASHFRAPNFRMRYP